MDFPSQLHLGMDPEVTTAFADKDKNEAAIGQHHTGDSHCGVEYKPPLQLADLRGFHLLGCRHKSQDQAQHHHLHRNTDEDDLHRFRPEQDATCGIHNSKEAKQHHADQIAGGGLQAHSSHINRRPNGAENEEHTQQKRRARKR